jgi:hypothetical protein
MNSVPQSSTFQHIHHSMQIFVIVCSKELTVLNPEIAVVEG